MAASKKSEKPVEKIEAPPAPPAPPAPKITPKEEVLAKLADLDSAPSGSHIRTVLNQIRKIGLCLQYLVEQS